MTHDGERVRLRALSNDDIPRWLRWINEPSVMDGLDRAIPATLQQHEAYFRRNVVENDSSLWFAIEAADTNEHVGIVWLWDLHWRHRRAEVRIVVGPEYSGRGYAGDALKILSAYAFETLGLHKLFAYVHAGNARSRAAFEKSGFQEEARLRDEAFRSGEFADVWRMARLAKTS